MEWNNQLLDATLSCFDPVAKPASPPGSYKNQTTTAPFENTWGVIHQEDGTLKLRYPDEEGIQTVEVEYCIGDGQRSIPGEYIQNEAGTGREILVTVPMVKTDGGVWELTMDPGPGYHDVTFLVNHVKVINPKVPWGYDGFGPRNFVEVADDPLFLLQDVPHGSLTRELFSSSVTGRTRACWVYTPPGYHCSQERYPVLYVQHGSGESEISWFQSGKIDILLDNLIAAGLAKPMILVTGNEYFFRSTETPNVYAECAGDEVMCRDIIPFIDGKYRTIPHREFRAAAGLSMGGAHSRRIALKHTDLFANLAMFSSGVGYPVPPARDGSNDFLKIYEDKERFNHTMKLVLVTCGDADRVNDHTQCFAEELAEKGFNIQFRLYHGRHEWNVWRPSMRDFMQMLWK